MASMQVPPQGVDLGKLFEEMRASGFVSGLRGISITGASLQIECDAITDPDALAALVELHTPVSLADKKAARILGIDARTREIIDGGFTFDLHQFSLSQQAQTNWLGLFTLQALMEWPMGVTDNADTTYYLAQSNLPAFLATGSGVIATAVGSGRALKIEVNAAITQAELDAVVDSR